MRDLFTFLVAGKAGEGVRKAGQTAADLFACELGRCVFEMDDYQSLIRGGHNFSVISTAPEEVTSHHMHADLLVALDDRSVREHAGHLALGGTLVYNSDVTQSSEGIGLPLTTQASEYPDPGLRVGVASIAALCAALGMDREGMREILSRAYARDLEHNLAYGEKIFDLARSKIGGRFSLTRGTQTGKMLTGNEAICLGAYAAGMDAYLAYPMTPASSILHTLASRSKEWKLAVMQPESEVAVANMAAGMAFAGAKVMIGSSGGGFALMVEAFSLDGMAEVPVLHVLSQRSGPSTGVPTYTEQADLSFALSPGHGDFPRIVASPGAVTEAFSLAADLIGMVWRFQTPGILLTEKHLSESSMSVRLDPHSAPWAVTQVSDDPGYARYRETEDGISPLRFPPSKDAIKWNSYEHDEMGITTEQPEIIARMHEKRAAKSGALLDAMKGIQTINVFGESGPLILTYGSTTMSVLEALRTVDLMAVVVQPIYLCPFPDWALEPFKGREAVVVEMSISGQFESLLRDKAGIRCKASIRKYDGRPFDPIELGERIREVV